MPTGRMDVGPFIIVPGPNTGHSVHISSVHWSKWDLDIRGAAKSATPNAYYSGLYVNFSVLSNYTIQINQGQVQNGPFGTLPSVTSPR